MFITHTNTLLIVAITWAVHGFSLDQNQRLTGINWPGAIVANPTQTAPLKVLIDVGHGGHDRGAPGLWGALEKDICLRIGLRTRMYLERLARREDLPITVRLSRENDEFLALKERVRLANNWGADLFISIHANSSPVPKARGFEVYFLSAEASDAEARRVARQENIESPTRPSLSTGVLSILSDLQTTQHVIESSRFAEVVYAALADRLRSNVRGVRQAPFTVLSGTQMPALLIEVGYLTHAEEARQLKTPKYQQRIATSLARGIVDFALQMRRTSVAPAPVATPSIPQRAAGSSSEVRS